MDYLTRQAKEEHARQMLMDAERAINEEVHKFNLEYAELSLTMRELLGKVYIRGGMDTLEKIREDAHEHLKT